MTKTIKKQIFAVRIASAATAKKLGISADEIWMTADGMLSTKDNRKEFYNIEFAYAAMEKMIAAIGIDKNHVKVAKFIKTLEFII